MSIIVPILSTFNAAGVNAANKKFSELETVSAKTGAALQSAFLPALAAIAGVGAVMSGAVNAASDLSEQISKTTVVFGASSQEILDWSTTTASSLGIARDQALEAAGTFGNMLVPMGFARDKAAEMSQKMVALAADMASFNNASPKETLDALRSGLAGETEPLRRFGVFLSDATQKQEALNLGLYSGKGNLEASAKAAASYSLILKQTGDAQGDFARTGDGLANQQRKLSALIRDAQAAIGKALLPTIEKLIPILTKAAQIVGENSRIFLIATGAILGTAAAVVAINGAMKAYTAITKLATAAQFVFNTVVKANIFVRLALAAAAVVIAYEAIQTSSKSAGDAMATWARRAQFVGGAIIAVFAEVVKVVAAAGFLLVKAGGLFGKVIDPILGTNLGGKADEWAGAIDRFGQGVTNFEMRSIDFANGKSSEKVKSALGGILDAVKVANKTFSADPGQSAIANYPAAAIAASGTKAAAAAKTAASKAAAATQKAADALKAKAVQLKATLTSALDKAFGQFSSDALRAYDAETQRLARGIDTNLSATLDGIDRTLTQRVDAIRAKLGETLTGINTQETALTPAEVALAAAQADRAQILAARDLAAAEKQLAAARKDGDLEAIAEAELHLADMRAEASLKALSELADAERKAARDRADLQRTAAQQAADIAEKAVQDEAATAKTAAENSYNTLKTDLDNERSARREALDLQLADLGEQLDKQPGKYIEIHKVLMGLFKTSFGPDFAQAAANLGQSFADGLSSKESAVGIAAARLAQAAAPVGGVSTPADAIRAAGIATSGADRSAGVNLTVNAGIGTNGAQVGQTIVDALNAWTLRNGALPARWIT